MNDWASRRKNIYLSFVVGLFTLASVFLFFRFWYQEPSCFDGKKNGEETGIDCGGSCSLVCNSEAIAPIVRWDPRMFEVIKGLWSVVTYVDNPNIDADAIVKYKITIYGKGNEVIAEKNGLTLLPKNKTVGVFEGAIPLGEMRPTRAIFEIDKNITWRKNDDKEEKISIRHSPILRAESNPRVEALVTNNHVRDVKNVELVAVVFDSKDNAIAASRTFIEKINKNQSQEVFFTWPTPFELGSHSCQKPSDIMLAIDRSGSMTSLSKDPPEPLTSVKKAASLFSESMSSEDRVGVVSFASTASNPVDSQLITDIDTIINTINGINISSEGGTQYTNMYDAIRSSRQELLSGRDTNKVIILLTDGIATHPKDPLGKSENDDVNYAKKVALAESQKAKSENITIFTIGLGDEIDQDFLKNLASEERNYFITPTPDGLKSIYSEISTAICKEMPAYIEITYKLLN